MTPSCALKCGLGRFPGDGMSEPDPVSSGTVLMVEDEPDLARMFQHIFGRANVKLATAATGWEAMRLFHSDPQAYSLLFVDHHLPDMAGSDLCEHLRTIIPGLPVLLVSGADRHEAYLQLRTNGPTAFMRKPYLPVKVLDQARCLMTQSPHSAEPFGIGS